MKTIVITSPGKLKDEAQICNNLFAHGLQLLHLRKPDAAREDYEEFILQIEPRYRNRIVLHGHYGLAEAYRLHGIHLKYRDAGLHDRYPDMAVSISCHSTAEIAGLDFQPAYCFLSPVFDSISKQGYTGRLAEFEGIADLHCPVIALGGIRPEHTDLCRSKGFSGVAALGYIWEKPEEALERFIRLKTPFVMSIAGFDPSSGAGVTADLKTFENTGSYGLGICTALTYQNEDCYEGTRWSTLEEIRKQCGLQFRKHLPGYIKIGLIEDFNVLTGLAGFIRRHDPDARIIWDPILKASAGFCFHETEEGSLDDILPQIYLLTPNTDEVHRLFGSDATPDSLQALCRKYGTNILWKGGHNEGPECSDLLITPEKRYTFTVPRSSYGKHGTGCILSSALTSLLAQDSSLPDACNKAQLYIAGRIDSNDSNLSYHNLLDAGYSSKPHPSTLNLQYITAPKEGMSLAEQVENVCKGGMRWVQLRMKDASFAEMIREGRVIREICRRYNTLFIINDKVEVARALDADGVHLGKEDMDPVKARKILGEGKIIGATCNSWEDILLRRQQQVDYIGLGPFTFTTTKKKLSPVLGTEGYTRLLGLMRKNHIPIPVYAIGGITEEDIPALMATGIQGIALSGLIKNSRDLEAETRKILKILA